MNIRDIYTAKAVALQRTEAASNRTAYLGRGLFPAKKKAGLDLSWIKSYKGLPVTLMPSTFDTKATLRSREGFELTQTQMAFFREAMIVKEQDEQDMLRVIDGNDPMFMQVMESVYDDANTLLDAADVVPERMIMQLLSPSDGHPKISIEANGATYAYNYDPNNTYSVNNFAELTSSTDKWSDTENSDPIDDIQTAQDAVESLTGTKPSMMIVSRQTMNYLRQNAKVKQAILSQNVTANVYITDQTVINLFQSLLGITIIVYTKQFKDETGMVQKFYPDGFATLIPDGALGSTWYGTTPEERSGMQDKNADVYTVDGGATICVTTTVDPVQTKTIASEIVLPSFERMDETYVIKCY